MGSLVGFAVQFVAVLIGPIVAGCFAAITASAIRSLSPDDAEAVGAKTANRSVCIGPVDDNLRRKPPRHSDVIEAHMAYTVGLNEKTHCPDWTVHRLNVTNLVEGKVGRSDCFHMDKRIPHPEWIADYNGSGWRPGQMVPAGDMKWSEQAMKETFLMGNLIPQDPKNISGAWNRVEQKVREWAKREGSLLIITGPIYDESKPERHIGTPKVRVPDAIFKAVLDETFPWKMIAFISPNEDTQACPHELVVTVDEVERRTGMDLFAWLPEQTQEDLESHSDFAAW